MASVQKAVRPTGEDSSLQRGQPRQEIEDQSNSSLHENSKSLDQLQCKSCCNMETENGCLGFNPSANWYNASSGDAPAKVEDKGETNEVHDEVVKAKVAKDPGAPTKEEIERHNISHVLLRAWCRSCVLGRAVDAAYTNMKAEQAHTIPTVMHYYGFLGRGDEKCMPMLVSSSLVMKMILMVS